MGQAHALRPEILQQFSDMQKARLHVAGQGFKLRLGLRVQDD